MAEEQKLASFTAHRTVNGGWVLAVRDDRYDRQTVAPEYAYSSDRDMLAALPGLIGSNIQTSEMIDHQLYRKSFHNPALERQRADDAVEATKVEVLHHQV